MCAAFYKTHILHEGVVRYVVFFALLDVLSMATALDDFIAPDCRFINIKKGQMVYVYSKLVPEEGTGVFWSGSVCASFFFFSSAVHNTAIVYLKDLLPLQSNIGQV